MSTPLVDTSEPKVSAADRDYVQGLFPAIGELRDPDLQRKVIGIWVKMWRLSKWERIEDCPYTRNTAFAVGRGFSLVSHVNSGTKNSLRMAESLSEDFDIQVDRQKLITLCLLHDVSKLVESEREGDNAVASEIGRTFPHAMIGGFEAARAGIDPEVVSAIIKHPLHPPHIHTRPVSVEHVLQHYGDLGTADPISFLNGIPTHFEKKRMFEMPMDV